ncbi:MAG: VCBS repeat-containing protein [Gemmatimonadaceae bacterium]|nr:VCBS repeat-containing protein [Gemmatimonadaceae bacterium]
MIPFTTPATRVGVGIALMLALNACGTADTPRWHESAGVRWRELTVAKGTPGFTRMDGRQTGIRFQNAASEKILLGNRMFAQGGGVSMGDVDGDGLPDVFLARTEGCSALYRNAGNWQFEDITTRAGVGACDRRSTGSALADVDGDTDLDLILLATTGPNTIYLNDGNGHFSEHRDLGLDTVGRGATTVTMADVDGSGHLALFIANYKPYSVDDTIPPQQRAFNQMVRQTGPTQYEILPDHRRDYKLVMRPDMGGMRMTQRAEPDEFYANDGRGHFTRVPMTSERFRDANGAKLAEEFESFGLSAKFVDLNGDGAPDLYVANDFEDTDQLWYNDGKGNFRLADWRSQRQMSNSAMGIDVADVNGDGRPDLFETDMLSNDPRRLKTQMPTHTSLPKKIGEQELQLQFQRNALFINRGDGTFAEVSNAAGVQASGWSWGSIFMDVDLDGWQDILVANGHLWDIMDADVQEGLQNRLNDVPWRRQRWEFPALKLRNVAFRNRGDLTFEDASSAWRFGIEEDVSHGIASADLDGDGDLDVVINRLGAPALVLRNDATAARIAVRLRGEAPNTQAVGARLTLHGGAIPVQVREIVVGGLYLSHSDYAVSFAMGAADSAELVVDWRDGRRTTMPVRANRLYDITQQSASSPTTPPTPGTAAGATLFVDATSQLNGHTHVENEFDDWDRQFLLPNALSRSGPGVSWYDIDRDGAEDLIVGTGKGGRLAVFRSVAGRLVAQPTAGPVAAADFTAVLGMTSNGATSLLAGVATWEFRSEKDMIAQPAAVRIGASRGVLAATPQPAVGSHESSTGPLALGDYDGDGALDLFVGSRAMPLRYPMPASSGLFRNVNGSFVIDTANLAVLRNIGMVTSAMFADMNGDGHADLVLSRDWGALVLLFNDGHGKLLPAPDSWALAAWTSQWNGVAAGDLNGDGKMDLVATSWGRNTGSVVDSAHPLVVTYGAFGAGGEVEMLLGQPDARVNGLSPVNSFPRVRMAVAGILGRVNNFAAYADASVETVLGSALSTTQQLRVRTLDHLLFINRGDHFEAAPLPAESQWSPAFTSAIADFDGDGAEDVFLSQNFFPSVIGSPRYDQGRSLLLQGDGKGGLAPLAGQRSGLMVYGDQRGAAYADFNGDGRLDLAVSQNGDATRLFENRGATPGLRVRVKGPATNPDGVGTQLRVVYGTTMGPVREVQTSAGYWSQNGAVQVMGLSGTPTALWVRWPGGTETRMPVPPGAREVVVTR